MPASTLNVNSPNSRDRSTHGGTQHSQMRRRIQVRVLIGTGASVRKGTHNAIRYMLSAVAAKQQTRLTSQALFGVDTAGSLINSSNRVR